MNAYLKSKRNLLFLFLSIVLTLPAIIGLLHSGFPITDDGNWMIIRLSAFYEALRSGQFPVRFLLRLNNGFGYPVADFLYPLFLYIGSFIHILGFNFINCIKILFGISVIFSSIFTFLWLRKRFDNFSSILGAIIFVYFPYHLYDIYVRGSVGEVLSFSIVPFILWQIEIKNLLFMSLGVTLLILSHNSLAIFFLPLIFIYGILRNRNYFKFLLVSFILGFISASFFWIPAIVDLQFTKFNTIKVSDFYNYFLNLNNFNILGFPFIIILISGFSLFFIKKYTKDQFFVFSLIFTLIILFLITSVSKPVWEIIPFKSIIQFPFRLISILVLFSSYFVALILNLTGVKYRNIIFLCLIFIIFLGSMQFLTNIKYQYFEDTFYSTNLSTTTVKNEYMPKWVKQIPQNYPYKRVLNSGNESVNVTFVKQNQIRFNTFLLDKRQITLNIAYFPGWYAKANNLTIPISYNNPNGLITLSLNKGNNNVEVYFSETPIRQFFDILSIIGFGLIFLVYFLHLNKKIKF